MPHDLTRHRRAQRAEGVADQHVEACRRQGVSLGRGLATWAARMMEQERDEARDQLAPREAEVARLTLALRNVRALAVRMQRRGVLDAEHLLRFVAEAGVAESVLRDDATGGE